MNVAQKFVRDFDWLTSGDTRYLASLEDGPTSIRDYMHVLDSLRSAQEHCIGQRSKRRFGVRVNKDKAALEWQALERLVLELYIEAEEEEPCQHSPE